MIYVVVYIMVKIKDYKLVQQKLLVNIQVTIASDTIDGYIKHYFFKSKFVNCLSYVNQHFVARKQIDEKPVLFFPLFIKISIDLQARKQVIY